MLPAKIKGLNQESSEESNDEEEESPITKEALEQKTQQEYRVALVLQKQNKLLEAEKILKNLLQSDVLHQAVGKVQYLNGKLQPSIFHLKYCCYLNLGNIVQKQKDYKSALEFFVKATELDDTDLNLWYKIGNVAMKVPNLMFAISAFMEALIRNPNHWPSLDSIINASFAVGDYMATLLYISHALKLDSNYLKGIVLKDKITKKHPVWVKDFKLFYPQHDLNVRSEYDETEAESIFQSIEKIELKNHAFKSDAFAVESKSSCFQSLSKQLKNRTWLCLGKFLLKSYNHLKHCGSDSTFFSIINIKTSQDETILKELQNDAAVMGNDENTPMEVVETQQKSDSVLSSENQMKLDGKEVQEADDDEDDDVLTELVGATPKSNEGEKDNNEGGSRPKRRKCSPTLADQLKMCDKRRSTRNKTVLKSNEQSLSKILKNLLPTCLLPEKDKISKNDCYDLIRWNEDSFDTMDIYRLLFENQDSNNLPSHPINELSEGTRNKRLNEEDYFGTDEETKDIDWYIKINNDQMILELLEAYLRDLASKWKYTWPDKLANIFIEMYQILRKHGFEGNRIQLIENWDMKNELDEDSLKLLKEKLSLVLLYGELLLNQCLEGSSKEQPLGNSILGGNFSSLLLGDMHASCSLLNATQENLELWLRSCWLEALLFLHKKDTFGACCALSMIIDELPKTDVEVRLPNMKQFYQISLAGAKRLLNTLYRNQNLNEVKILFAENQFDRIIEILKETLKPDSQQLMYLPNENTLSRCQQYDLLFKSLWETKNYEDLFKWCEVACYEGFVVYRKSFFDEVDTDMKSQWASLVMKTISGMLSCLQLVGPCILDVLKCEHLSRLVQSLCNLVCHQIEASEPSAEITADVVTPWILLVNLIDYNEKKEGINNSNDDIGEVTILPSLQILFIAHEFLGKRSWCCFDDGALLFYTLDVIGPMFPKCTVFSTIWTNLSQQVDQIFYCLYAHPFKRNKPRYVQDHNTYGLALTWNRAIQAYLFYRPITLPMFDAVSKSCTISADTETLFARMVPLVPEDQNPSRFLESLHQFMNSSLDKLPENKNKLQDEIVDLYYILGDYYFKNKIMKKAIKYYSLDVCCNPRRVDSWAAMALARGSQLEMKLNSCESIHNESDILKKSEYTDKCFKMALKLDYYQSTLWIEYGVFCYGIHGFCSRLLKQETSSLSLQMFDMVEKNKNKFLKTSFTSFNHANEAWLTLIARQEEVHDERWLNHYMLGKIAEKKEENIAVCLNHYYEASKFLHENKAEYPMRILYSSPQYYSVEALEVYFRIHASILKMLEYHEDNPLDRDTIEIIEEFIKKTDESPFVKARVSSIPTDTKVADKPKENICEEIMKECSHTKSVDEVVKDVLEELISRIEKELNNKSGNKRKCDEGNQPNDCKTKKLKTDENKSCEEIVSCSINNSSFAVDEELPATEFLKADSAEEKSSSKSASQSPSLVVSVCSSSVGSPSESTSSDSSSRSSESQKSDNGDGRDNKKESKTMDHAAWEIVRKSIAEKCIASLEECITRFPEHYKSYYRLSHYYFRSNVDRNIEKARKLLIEQGGLFADRTIKNFFCGIWRIPIGEIDRSGSFAFHMSRSVHLLIDILRDSQDYKTLFDLSIQLRCKPDLDKKYLRDNEREEISKEALSLGVQALRRIIDNIPPTETEENKRKLLLNVYKCYHKVIKNCSQKDLSFGKLLVTMFFRYAGKKDKISLDQILTYCKSLNCTAKTETTAIAPVAPVFPATDENEISKALTHVINMSLNEQKTSLLTFPSIAQTMVPKLNLADNKPSPFPPVNNSRAVMPSLLMTSVPKPKLSSHQINYENAAMILGLSKTAIAINQNQSFKTKPNAAIDQIPLLKLKLKNGGVKKAYEKVNKPSLKEKQPKSKKMLNEMDMSVRNNTGLSITPVMKTPAGQLNDAFSVPSTTNILKTQNKAEVSKQKISDGLNAQKNCSVVITPVELNTQLTLQQKLAAKQLANTVKNSSSSKTVPKTSTTAFNKASLTAMEKARNLGSSGVSIFPIPSVPEKLRYLEKEDPNSKPSFSYNFLPSKAKSSPPVSSYQTFMPAPGPSSSSSKSVKKSLIVEMKRLNNVSNSLVVDHIPKSKMPDNKLNSKLKALEENAGIVITRKLPQTTEIEVISLIN